MSARFEIVPDSLITVEADELSSGNDWHILLRYMTALANCMIGSNVSVRSGCPKKQLRSRKLLNPFFPEAMNYKGVPCKTAGSKVRRPG